MKFLKKLLLAFLLLLLVLVFFLFASGNAHIFKGLKCTYLTGNTTANINDYNQFKTNTIVGGNPQVLQTDNEYNVPLNSELTAFLEESKSAAFLILKDGKLVSEHYFGEYNDRSKTNSFSVAKTITTMLIGTAIKDRYIESLNQPITDFIEEFKDNEYAQNTTIEHLANMTSGYDWDEHYYSPFSLTPKLYYGKNSTKFLLDRAITKPSGEEYYYSSASTQLLGIVLTRAIGDKTISEYASEKLWKPLGMNDDGLWHTDATGMEFTYCCVNTNARNFAKLGQLLLQNGVWNNKEILDSSFVEKIHSSNGLVDYYGLSGWLFPNYNPKFYCAEGHLGQFIIVIPEKNMVVVRLGETRLKDREKPPRFTNDAEFYVSQALSLTEHLFVASDTVTVKMD